MEINEKTLLNTLLESLAPLAGVTGGYATLTDIDGRRIKTVNSKGEELQDMKGKIYDLAQKGGQENKPFIGPSQIEDGAEAWVIPIGSYVLCCSNVERVQREGNLRNALEKALPLIAKVVGGEAVIFDKQGKRISSYNPDGSVNRKFINKISKAALKAMQTNEPVVGDSISFEEALAVRIPITSNFGFGFNNEVATQKNKLLMDEVKKFQFARYNFSDIIGQNEAFLKVVDQAKHIASSNSTVLIYGETGTGKELFAQSIHNASERRNKPFVAINCGALPATLIESSLFGYDEGAFTGAKKGGAPGAFEQADGGTIFLDEISEMELNLQIKILRVLQEREITRIGGKKPLRINVRVISSTNKDLVKMISENKFRSDLFFRLNVLQIKVTPLRERPDDISLLARYFIRKHNNLLGKYVEGISKEALNILKEYPWPGNVRELQNCVEYALNMMGKEEHLILPQHLPPVFRPDDQSMEIINQLTDQVGTLTLGQIVMETEKIAIEKALVAAKYKKKEAAEMLGISTITLWRKMQQYNDQQ
ncbi:sigma-54 interaction domain-containing protein [Dehalobacterium formicoaceticum]|uniref:Sigma 54-interacting transcriptional regulator n=1 Tax=Dehalobacterium formicoaceticum TaxID=51515 RepID=A0ABT1Y845_9FIRM|nr:sigma 54-interacting transcriptional regulator [Dehalobacterium formicoaceticum]MCR6547038.1 sigma 54-interacting transcriptional regulator [Dehalobacterium formicoaceticum]